jgi:hypothetical protein
MHMWVIALVPTLIGVLPVRDYFENAKDPDLWYGVIRWFKIILLTVAIVLILCGAWFFGRAIWPIGNPTEVPGSLHFN